MRAQTNLRCAVVAPPPMVRRRKPSWRRVSLRFSVFSAPLRRLSILTLLNLVMLLAPVAAQRDPEVDVRARLFAEVGAGVAAIKSRTVAVGQTSRSAPVADEARAAARPSDTAKPQAAAAS
ncbi:MAG: hypothetical protein L0338_37600, partial [Acidobacteria bacterium]|nr:hypothetical protein [Acidobacteriota bacterium]